MCMSVDVCLCVCEMYRDIHVGGGDAPVMITVRTHHLFLLGDVVKGLDFTVRFGDTALEYGAIQHDVVRYLKYLLRKSFRVYASIHFHLTLLYFYFIV